MYYYTENNSLVATKTAPDGNYINVFEISPRDINIDIRYIFNQNKQLSILYKALNYVDEVDFSTKTNSTLFIFKNNRVIIQIKISNTEMDLFICELISILNSEESEDRNNLIIDYIHNAMMRMEKLTIMAKDVYDYSKSLNEKITFSGQSKSAM